MTKRAVVVGINDYSHQVDGWPNLSYCVADANAVYHMVLDSFGFDPASVTLLTNQAASSANIRRALGHMLAESEPGDVAFFFYSGHGGLHPGSTPGVFFQSICPATGRYITDWDLAQAANSLPPSTVNFTVMMDSCHSGGMGDLTPQGSAAKTAVLSQELITKVLETMKTVVPMGVTVGDPATFSNNITATSAATGPIACYTEAANREFVPSAKSLLYSAARWDEYAQESSDVQHGYLTKAFMDTVNTSPFEITNQALHSSLHTKVHAMTSEGQSPVMRGQANRAQDIFLAPYTSSI